MIRVLMDRDPLAARMHAARIRRAARCIARDWRRAYPTCWRWLPVERRVVVARTEDSITTRRAKR